MALTSNRHTAIFLMVSTIKDKQVYVGSVTVQTRSVVDRAQTRTEDVMYKLKKAAVVVAMLSGVGLLGGGIAHADGRGGADFKLYNPQNNNCPNQSLINIPLNLGIAILGEVKQTTVGGSQCVETGPTFGGK
jgi:hypothetical protein